MPDKSTIQVEGKDLDRLRELKDRMGFKNLRSVVRYLLALDDINEELGQTTLFDQMLGFTDWMRKHGIEKGGVSFGPMIELLKTDYDSNTARQLAFYIVSHSEMWGDKTIQEIREEKKTLREGEKTK